eukprot:COSAG06_NODE_4706_length_4024_cov_2.305478_7_plen_50_part_00
MDEALRHKGLHTGAGSAHALMKLCALECRLPPDRAADRQSQVSNSHLRA